MTAFKADPRGRTFPRGRGRFNPEGKIESCAQGDVLVDNPPTWRADVTYAARIFVGFNVGNEERWALEDLIKLVRRWRRENGAPEDSTFLAQRGVYTHKSGEVVNEPGGQVIIFDQGREGEDESARMARFQEEMIALSEAIAFGLEQAEVILEIQRNGQSVVTMGVEP